jgi:hypothetical protein
MDSEPRRDGLHLRPSADYEPHQPGELLELARLTLDAASDDGHVEVLGSLRGGRTVFVTIALPDDIDIAGDVHMPRLVWVTSMDGTIATRAVSTYVRAVCANTIRASFRQTRASWAARQQYALMRVSECENSSKGGSCPPNCVQPRRRAARRPLLAGYRPDMARVPERALTTAGTLPARIGRDLLDAQAAQAWVAGSPASA